MLSHVNHLPFALQRPSCCNVAASRQVHRLVVPQATVPGRHAVEYGSNGIAAAALAAILLSSGPAAAAGPLAVFEGPARIVDGDTLYIGTEKVRLYAVDAPEKTQACTNSRGESYMCGQVALQALKERVGTRPVHCEVKSKDQYGRNVAACSIMDGRLSEDMGSWLVANGHAVAYKQFGKDYIVMEEKAHAMKKGVWQGEFTEPALWRKQQRAASLNSSLSSTGSLPGPLQTSLASPAVAPNSSSSSQAAAPLTYAAAAAKALQQQQPAVAAAPPLGAVGVGSQLQCGGPLIKGNINSKGQKIYHTTASGSYARVEIDEKAGERYFCTEAEAQAAGWRAALK
uniref:TNase-like domain-containing protein n=1 Tax=Tetradesmus obliquus TaxID=3088 RepID=A0A383VJI2_TETOB|eukprot:jgi/Sobl393_1/19626/SZX65688.1